MFLCNTLVFTLVTSGKWTPSDDLHVNFLKYITKSEHMGRSQIIF